MKKALKIILIIVVSVIVLSLLAMGGCALLVKKGFDELEKSASEVEGQTTTVTAEGATIVAPLTAKEVVSLTGVSLCNMEADYNAPYSYSSSCAGTECTALLSFKGAVPETITVYRRHNGECKRQDIPNGPAYVVRHYDAEFALNKETLRSMGIEESAKVEIDRADTSKFQGRSSFGFNGNYTVTLNYDAQVPQSDTILVNGKPVTLTFEQPAN